MGDVYPEVREKLPMIQKAIKAEEERFHMTLNDGLAIVNQAIAKLKAEGKTEIDGATAFTFYDTYGFPIDLTQDMAEEAGMTVDAQGFEDAMAKQRELSKKPRKALPRGI